ncbi:MAG TPA: phosphatase PAP2 family protein [Flavipsychrobacter sp.]|nr:phosphatase PAP2 family protein [Flavipsychrobacter sp.]
MRFNLLILLFCFSIPSFSQGLDLDLYDNLHGNRNHSLDGFMEGVSMTTYPIALAVPLGQVIYSFAKHDETSIENAAHSVGSLLVTAAMTYGIKYAVRRDRPYITHPQYTPYEYDTGPSMPSGHTSFAFATAANLSLQYKRWYVVVPAFIYAGAVGYSRIHLGAHYPSDVLVGALVGAGSSFATYKAQQWLKRKWKKSTEKKFLD